MISAIKSFFTEKKQQLTRTQLVLSRQFPYLLALTGFFILIELAFFVLCNDSYLYVFMFVSNKMQLPYAMLPGILFFVFAQLLIHFLFCLVMAVFAAMMIDAYRVKPENHLMFSMAVLIAAVITVLLANSYYFPNSHFAQLCSVFFSHEVMGWVLFIAFVAWARFLRPGTLYVYAMKPGRKKRVQATLVLIFTCIILFKFIPTNFTSTATPTKPNIIIVGVDSLRPDMLNYFSGEAQTPFMSEFLTHSTVFSEAITPLARTYPSWVGILSGQYPVQTGVRTNLSGLSKVDLAQMLPALLQQQGYETLYATDETRFSNIDKKFGFDTTITPPVGLNDFLLGTFNDFPLSNLVVNTFAGKWLFPYSYANRAAYVTYNPNSFLNLMRTALLRDHQQSVFLAVHFCLPHHPYLYNRIEGETLTGQQRYVESIQRVDLQLQDFFVMLRQAHLLDHAVVVLLSDHGEALEFAGDRITEREAYLPHHHRAPEYYPPSKDPMEMNQSVGHGSDVLGLPQYHSLLAFRLYGVAKQDVRVVPGVVTLLDIKPTLIGSVAPDAQVSTSGVSLMPLVTGKAKRPPQRMLFLESDYSPDAVRSIYPETRKLLLQGADLFQVSTDNTRLIVKPEMVEMIIKSKQYAVIYDGWMLALYPQPNRHMLPVLINLKSGAWTTDLSSTFAHASPASSMNGALKKLYGDEV